MNKLKPFIIVLSSLLIFPIQFANTCSWGYEIDESTLSPFNAEMLDLPDLFPFYYSEHYFNGDPNVDWSENTSNYDESLFDGSIQNLKEWSTYFNGAEIEDIDRIIYGTTEIDYDAFKQYLRGKKQTINEEWQNNEVMKFWQTYPDDASFNYLMLAKQIEPHVQSGDWWETVPRDTILLTNFKKTALQELKKSKNTAIKIRYAYQACRTAHYTRSYKECINIYNEYVAPLKDESQINYWCMSLMAGAHWRLNQFAEAAYYNSIVFDKCISRRLSAERDFWIDNETTWQKCLAMCKSDHEKSILWLLTGINQYNSAVPAIEQMLQIDPGAKEIELLIAREIEKIQRNNMPLQWWDGDVENFDEVNGTTTIPPNAPGDLINVINKGIQINKMYTPSFWYNSAAFLYFIEKQPLKCAEMCNMAIQLAAGDQDQIDQAKITHIINKISSEGKITTEFENEILPDLQWLSSSYNDAMNNYDRFKKDAYRLVMFDLMNYYLNDNQSILAELCRAKAVNYYDIYLEPETAPVDELYTFFTSTKKSPLQSFLAEQYPYNANHMLEIKGTLLMRQNDLEQAAIVFKKITNKNNYLPLLSADPFIIHINDCHDCDFIDHPTDINKLDLVEKILALQDLAESDKLNRAQIYHELGNAYYNITYWGNAWNAVDYYRCHGCETNFIDPSDSYFYYYNDQYDLSVAEKYYTLAVENASGNQFAALNYFMLAKCEQNNYYRSGDYSYENENNLKEQYRTNFYILHQMFSETDFYNEAISECKYFDYYVKTH